MKNKLKSEIFNGKKIYKYWKMTGKFQLNFNFNLNWKISTKNLVTFKRWDGVNDKNLNIMGVQWKSDFFLFFFDGGGGGGGAWIFFGGGGRGWIT